MFTSDDRNRLRTALIEAAQSDKRVTGAALTGSAARGAEDRWSDIDLALSVAAESRQVVADWTERMYREHGAVHHVDLNMGETLFRVFLLNNTLQVDLAFWPATQFGAVGPAFKLLFGTAQNWPASTPPAAGLIGMGWLYALHVRSSLARSRVWQAEYMISGMRDQALALACLRHDLPTVHARGVDNLPTETRAAFADTLLLSLQTAELQRAFAAVTDVFLAEIARADPILAERLAAPLRELTAM